MLKRVVIISDYAYVAGGVSKVAIASALRLAERGYEVLFASAVGPADERLTQAGIKVSCLNQADLLGDPSRMRALTRGLWNAAGQRLIDDVLADCAPAETVVHFHQWTKAFSPSVFASRRLKAFPRTLTHHDYFVACPNGGFLLYPQGRICDYRAMSAACVICNCDARNYSHKIWRVTRQMVQNALPDGPRGFAHQIFVSGFTRDILKPYLAPQAMLHVVGNPIDVAKGPRISAEANRDFVFIGRLSREKGGVLFAQAAKALGVPAVFIGEGECREEIAAANGSAEITGWVSGADVQQRLDRARFMIFPSLWYESQPLSVQEAQSRGIPCLLGDRSAAREMVADNETGLYFKNGDVEDLTRKMALLSDDALVRRLSENAYQRFWAAPRGIDAHVDNLLSVYDQVMRTHAQAA